MKYKQSKKQNQRITRISDKTLVVGADIAKETHVARAIDFRGIELGKDCTFSNTRIGLEKLVQWMKELQREHAKSDVLFGIEPTGHYWFTLAEYLGREGIALAVYNTAIEKAWKDYQEALETWDEHGEPPEMLYPNKPTFNLIPSDFWVEGMTPEEIAELTKPPEPTELEQLRTENTELKLALTELAEAQEADKTEIQLALAEIAGLIGGE